MSTPFKNRKARASISMVFAPKKQLGQVFLKNRAIIPKIIKAAELKPSDLVLEIGPGTGVLTEAILKTRAKTIAIEKDPSLAAVLREKFKNSQNLTIIQADIRDFLKNTENSKLDIEYKIIGNIPYYLTSHLLRLIFELTKKPKIIVLMVQKEVSQRILAKPPKMNLLAVSVQLFSKPEIIAYAPKSDFWPQPKVNSALVKFTPFIQPLIPNKHQLCFFRTVKAGFSHPRKLLINNLSQELHCSKDQLQGIFKKLDLPLNVRPQNLALENWLNLAKHLFA